MTREEAIKWFKESAFYHKDHEPFNMAISALEQQNERQKTLQKDIELAPMADKVLGTMIYPQVEGITPTVAAEPCEDAVSREAVIEGIEELKKSPWCTDKRNGYEYLIAEALDTVKDLCVKSLPSVTQKSGEWIRKESMGCPIEICSKCGEMGDLAYNFCPWCGADMRGESE